MIEYFIFTNFEPTKCYIYSEWNKITNAKNVIILDNYLTGIFFLERVKRLMI